MPSPPTAFKGAQKKKIPIKPPTRQRSAAYKRTRHGCERCRRRRRKCDEKKPQCQRCIDYKSPCQYASRIKFHHDNLSADQQPSATPQSGRTRNPSNAFPLDVTQRWNVLGQAPEGVIFLLQHYNQHVAPWLDVFDEGQTFATLVPRLGTATPSILKEILQISSLRTGRHTEIPLGLANATLTPQDYSLMLTGTPEEAVRVSVSFGLEKVQQFIGDDVDSWASPYSDAESIPSWVFEFSDPSYRRITLATATLFSRLDLAHSLINELPTPLDSSVLLDTAAAYFSRDLYCNDGFERMDAALKCLILLIDVCRLCFKPTLQQPLSVSTAPSSLQTDERTWARLINKLLDWYKNRPASLKPFMETEGSRTKPPTMLFTHNGAVWANMIYHVSMLIMTLHKPTGISFQIDPDLAETQESQLSSPWHTQRILATSCASDRRWWDPCMIAAFYFAEKHSNLSRHYM